MNSLTQRAAQLRERHVPTIVLALIVAVLTWTSEFDLPIPGLDASSNAGLFMAADRGLHFGTDIAYTYGPLGYLGQGNATLWFGGLAATTFIYAALVHVALCFVLLWWLRRSLGAIAAVIVTFVALGLLPSVEEALVVAAGACLVVLVPDRPRRALDVLVVGGATFAALQVLIKLSIGPPVFAIFLLALFGARAGARRLLIFIGLFAIEVPLLWALSGQDLGDLPGYARYGLEVISGYSEAMASGSAGWEAIAGVIALAGLAAAAACGDYRDRLARLTAAAVVGGAGFAVFKEGVVRFDPVHLTILFSSLTALFLLLALSGPRRPLLLAGATALIVLTRVVAPDGFSPRLDPLENTRFAVDQIRILASPSRRDADAADARADLRGIYALGKRDLGELTGRRVAIDPWEVGIAWAYDLDWSPAPVFQGYTAYTEDLDQLNADRIASDDGPERILRVNPAEVVGDSLTRAIDGRYPAWDPPAQALATLCHFVPVSTDDRFQVLARTEDRCGDPQPAGSVGAGEGEAMDVPAAGDGEVVFARIEGAGVSGLEKLRTTLYRAGFRFVTIDGDRAFRLVPGTAGDGLLLRGDPKVVGTGPFAQAPQARTIAISGAGGDLRVEFFRMRVAPR